MSLTEVALSRPPSPPHRHTEPPQLQPPLCTRSFSQIAWKQSQGVTGWMLGNRKRVAKGEESRGEKRKSPGLVQKSKGGGGLNNWELCCGNVDEAGTFFPSPLFGSTE